MDRSSWILAAALLGGCTALNGAFEDQQDSAAEGGTAISETSASTASDTGVRPTASGGGVTSVGEGSTDAPPGTSTAQTESTSTTGPSRGPTSSEDTTGQLDVTGQVAETGNADATNGSENRVVFIYAANSWMAPGNFEPETSANDHCSENAPDSTIDRCEEVRIALLRQPDSPAAVVFTSVAELWPNIPVFGIQSNGVTPLADSPSDLLGELPMTLTQGGVVDPSGNGQFFSGGTGAPVTCQGWTNPSSTAIAGSFNDNGSWFSGDIVECEPSRPILCACRSVPNPVFVAQTADF